MCKNATICTGFQRQGTYSKWLGSRDSQTLYLSNTLMSKLRNNLMEYKTRTIAIVIRLFWYEMFRRSKGGLQERRDRDRKWKALSRVKGQILTNYNAAKYHVLIQSIYVFFYLTDIKMLFIIFLFSETECDNGAKWNIQITCFSIRLCYFLSFSSFCFLMHIKQDYL